jgi:hypothetical protein
LKDCGTGHFVSDVAELVSFLSRSTACLPEPPKSPGHSRGIYSFFFRQ